MNQILDNLSKEQSSVEVKRFFAKVYLFMFGALLISGLIAWQYGTVDFAMKYLFHETAKGVKPNGLFTLLAFVPIGIAWIMQSQVRRLPMAALVLLFAAYSIILGFLLSPIFIVYTSSSIIGVFFASAGAFGVMAVMGFITPIDLTKFGNLLYMAFVGIFIASIVNWFMHSDMLGYIIAFIGVFVFTGLTAYYMQKLKEFAQESGEDEEHKTKMALIGGFMLYVTFINLFMSLLRLFGSRK